MNYRNLLAVGAVLLAGIAGAQNTVPAGVNSTGNDYLIQPSKPGLVYFVSDRTEVPHGSFSVVGCGKFKKPYSVFRAQNGTVEPVKDKGTERWAGPPVYSADREWMAVPVWNDECIDGIAGIKMMVYHKTTAKKAALTFDNENWDVLRSVGQPAFKTAWHPAFHPTKPLLYFEGEGKTGPAKIYHIPLGAGEPEPTAVELPGTEDAVYPTFVNNELHVSRPVPNRGLDAFVWNGKELSAVAWNTDGNDFHSVAVEPNTVWVSQRTPDRGTEVTAHLLAPKEAAQDSVQVEKPKAAIAAATPKAATPNVEPKKEAVQAPESPKPAPANGVQTWIAAGKFTNPDNAQRRAELLTKDPALASKVSVRYDGTSYSVVVNVPAGANAQALLETVNRVAPDALAVLKTVPAPSAASVSLEIYFDFDRSEIRPEEARRIRAYLASINGKSGTFDLIGHCDSRGSNAYNLQLGLRRAKSTKAFVESIRGSVNSTESSRSEWDLQEPCPDGMPCDENAHQRNRRVVLVFEPN